MIQNYHPDMTRPFTIRLIVAVAVVLAVAAGVGLWLWNSGPSYTSEEQGFLDGLHADYQSGWPKISDEDALTQAHQACGSLRGISSDRRLGNLDVYELSFSMAGPAPTFDYGNRWSLRVDASQQLVINAMGHLCPEVLPR